VSARFVAVVLGVLSEQRLPERDVVLGWTKLVVSGLSTLGRIREGWETAVCVCVFDVVVRAVIVLWSPWVVPALSHS
jgi:hypothetical protein